MKSIRRYLIASLIASLTAGSLLVGLFVYWNATSEINELYDENMRQFADMLQTQLEATSFDGTPALGAMGPSLATKIVHEQELLIQLWNKKGQQVYTSHRALALPLQGQTGFFIAKWNGREWRFYANEGRHYIIQVAQPQKARIIFTRQMALKLLLPMLALIPVIGFLIWLAVGRSLAPLHVISYAITQRSATSLEPLTKTDIPLEVKPLVRELNALLTRLKHSLETQRSFTVDAAHQLRTPLAALQLQLGNVRRATNDAEREKHADKLQGGIDRATHVVRQLLTLARVEPNTMEAQTNPVELSELARDVVKRHAEIAVQKHIDLAFSCSEQVIVPGSAENLRILLENLIGNALHYTPGGGKVNVSVQANADEDEVLIAVQDNGIGIPESERDKIFERFYRVLGTQAEGTGLGLSIALNIVRQHGGAIHVGEGLEGKGVGFTVLLPIR